MEIMFIILVGTIVTVLSNSAYYKLYASYLERIGARQNKRSWWVRYFAWEFLGTNVWREFKRSYPYQVDPESDDRLFLDYLYDKLNDEEKRLYWRGKIITYIGTLVVLALFALFIYRNILGNT